MELLIDRSGRIVVPKRLRERFGFRPDSEIEVVEGPGGLLLRPAQEKPSLGSGKWFVGASGGCGTGSELGSRG